MRVLIAEINEVLANLWGNHLARAGLDVELAVTKSEATHALQFNKFDALVMNLNFPDKAILAISDLATYRNPDIAIVVVSNDTFFSDGSIFSLIPNARGFFNDSVDPNDLTEIVKFYAA